MRIRSFEWDDDNTDHIAAHGVDSEEAEEVFEEAPVLLKAKYGRFAVIGPTYGGRFLTVIFERLGAGTVRVVTARDTAQSEKRLYRRRK